MDTAESACTAESSHFFEVKLDLFDGPLDLLLHLVKVRELEIEKVSLAAVAGQYMQCIENMRRLDLEVAGEYLVIAATLLSIKSSFLLGEPPELVQDEDGNLVDPHEALLRRLSEAAIYKESAGDLSRRALLGLDVFAPQPSLGELDAPEPEWVNHEPLLLGRAFRKLLSNLKDGAGMQISYDPVSIAQRMVSIMEALKASGPTVFYKLVPDLTSRASIISTFIALLELCKRRIIGVEQREQGAEIEIVLLSGGPVDISQVSSEFDTAEESDKPAIANG